MTGSQDFKGNAYGLCRILDLVYPFVCHGEDPQSRGRPLYEDLRDRVENYAPWDRGDIWDRIIRNASPSLQTLLQDDFRMESRAGLLASAFFDGLRKRLIMYPRLDEVPETPDRDIHGGLTDPEIMAELTLFTEYAIKSAHLMADVASKDGHCDYLSNLHRLAATKPEEITFADFPDFLNFMETQIVPALKFYARNLCNDIGGPSFRQAYAQKNHELMENPIKGVEIVRPFLN